MPLHLFSLARPVARTAAFILLAVATLNFAPSGSNCAIAHGKNVATIHEARLRKLHLVRPDLICYPMSFDVLC